MTTLSKDEVIAMATEAGFLFSDKGYGPDVLHTDGLEYSSRCYERFATRCRAPLVAEIEGWKADQKENLANQCELQAEINALKAVMGQMLTALEAEQALYVEYEHEFPDQLEVAIASGRAQLSAMKRGEA